MNRYVSRPNNWMRNQINTCSSGMTVAVGWSAPPTSRRPTGTPREKRMKILDEKKYQLRLSGNVLERQSILLCVNSTALRICKYSKLYCKICYLSQHMNAGNGVNNRGKKRSDWTMPNSLTAVNVRSLCVQPTGPRQCRRKMNVQNCWRNRFLLRLRESFQTKLLLWHQSHLHLENVPTIGK